MKICYLMEKLDLYGGVLSVLDLVKELNALGIDAKIVTARPPLDMFASEVQFVFKNRRQMFRNFPPADIVVATLWTTAFDAVEIVKRNPRITPFYFIQDYESWFYPEGDRRTRCKVKETYGLITNKIVTSEWLSRKLCKDGYASEKVPYGLEHRIFFPRPRIATNARILGLSRPTTPRRGFLDMLKVFKSVKDNLPHIEIIFFGTEDMATYDIAFSYTNAGIVTGSDLAELYSSCDVYLDSSLFHGFGRMGLEAMACGCACVLTDSGGVSEYARNNYNSLIVPVGDTAKMAEAVIGILEDEELRRRLVRGGLETAKKYSWQDAAEQTRQVFSRALNGF